MGKGRGKGRGKGQGRTRGAKDFKQRKRRKATPCELAKNVAKRDLKRKKVQAEAEAAKQRLVGAIPSAPSGGAAGGRAATSHGDLGSENNIVGGGSDDDISDLNWDAIEAGAGCAGHSHQPQRPGEDDSRQASPCGGYELVAHVVPCCASARRRRKAHARRSNVTDKLGSGS